MNKCFALKPAMGILAIALLAACSAPEESTEEPIASSYNTELTVAEVMTLVLEPASDILWDSGGWGDGCIRLRRTLSHHR